MPEKNNMFAGFPPEKGSRDEEDQRVANLEKHKEIDEEPSGVSKKEDRNETSKVLLEQENEKRQIYINRARRAGDKRSDNEIILEQDNLEDRINQYQEKRKVDGTYTDPWETAVDYMKSNVKSYADYLNKRQKDDNSVIPWNVYLEWLDGKDFE